MRTLWWDSRLPNQPPVADPVWVGGPLCNVCLLDERLVSAVLSYTRPASDGMMGVATHYCAEHLREWLGRLLVLNLIAALYRDGDVREDSPEDQEFLQEILDACLG